MLASDRAGARSTRGESVSLVAGAVIITIGVLVLVGWATGIEALKNIVPGLIVMIPNTATGFILAGVSLLLQVRTEPSSRARSVAKALAAIVLVLGVLTFLERMFGFDFGIDLLLFPDSVRRYPYLPPGQMATNSTISFSLAGASLLLMDRRTKGGTVPAQWMALLGLGIAWIALVGYLYGARQLYAIDRAAGMALLTAIAFSFLQVGLLFARPRAGVVSLLTGDDLGAVMMRRLIPTVLAAPIVLGFIWVQARSAGVISREGSAALFAVLTICILLVLLLQTGRALRAADVERAEKARELEMQREEARAAAKVAEAARAEAESASRVRSDFLATMSHELRTPLNAVIGYSSLLRDELAGPLNVDQHRQLARIGTSARHLLTLIDEVLTLSRLEAGKETIVIEPIDVAHALDEAATIIEPMALARKLRFHVTPPREPTLLHADAGKLRQVLVNLLSNAVKFTDAGEVALAAWRDGPMMYFEVRDTGVGVAAHHTEQIFEPFFQVQQSVTKRAPGTGLGLSVSRRLARLLGGDVTVSSEPGSGSKFTLRLPVGPIDGVVRPEVAAPAQPELAGDGRTGGAVRA